MERLGLQALIRGRFAMNSSPYFSDGTFEPRLGDCRELLARLPEGEHPTQKPCTLLKRVIGIDTDREFLDLLVARCMLGAGLR